MSGWQMPPQTRDVRGSGPFVEDPDVIDFPGGSAIPSHFLHWRFPPENAFTVSPPGHPNTLQLRPTKTNLTSTAPLTTIEELSLIMRVQTDTLFSFSVDVVSFEPKLEEEEVGITAFLTQTQHLDLGIVMLPTTGNDDESSESEENLALHLRFRVTNMPALPGDFNGTLPTIVKAVPKSWLHAPIRLSIEAINETHFALFAASSNNPSETEIMGTAPATILSGGDGEFSGEILLTTCKQLFSELVFVIEHGSTK